MQVLAGGETLRSTVAAFIILFVTVVAGAQVTASQPSADEVRAIQGKPPALTEMCPLQIDVDLSKTPTHRSLAELPIGSPWVAKGVQAFVCDKAHFVSLSVVKEKEKRDKVRLVVSPRQRAGSGRTSTSRYKFSSMAMSSSRNSGKT